MAMELIGAAGMTNELRNQVPHLAIDVDKLPYIGENPERATPRQAEMKGSRRDYTGSS